MRLWIFLILVLLLPAVNAECTEPTDSMTIKEDVVFCSRTFDLPNGLIIGADDITIDCNTGILRGNSQSGTGITIEGRKNVLIQNCNIVTYKVGVYVKESSQITITKNSFLKNQIGVRLLNSYENIVSDNADKSTERPLSVINSKFNIFMIGNKNIETEFCEENLCNEVGDINPCANDDFYCSERCNPGNDNDCKPEQVEIIFETPKEKSINTTAQTPTAKVIEPQETKIITQEQNKSWWYIYPVVYILAFLMLQFYTFTKKY